MKKLSLLLLVLLNACQQNTNTVAQTENTQSLTHEEFADWTAKEIQKAMQENDIPAVAVGIIRDGEIIYKDGFGTFTRESDENVTSNTIFQIASISKMFTGLVVSHLIEEGKLELHREINFYLEDILTERAKKTFKGITLQQLMQHQAGIPNYACSVYGKAKADGFSWDGGYSEEELIEDINTIELDFEPGTRVDYSNSGYNIAGYICEKVTGMEYEELVKKYVTSGREMPNTVKQLSDVQKKNIAMAYPPSDPKRMTGYSNWGKATPASGLFSNVDDLMVLMQDHLDAYREFLKDSTMSPMILTDRKSLDTMLMNEDPDIIYGLGLMKWPLKKGDRYQHDGDADGYTLFYSFTPELNTGKVLLTSSGGGWVLNLEEKIEAKLTNTKFIETLTASQIVKLVNEKGIAGLKEELSKLDEEADREKLLDPYTLNVAGYELIKADKLPQAIEVFKLGTELYPEEANFFDSLGEAYKMNGQNEPALESYRKALEINPEYGNAENAKKIIAELESL